MSAFLITYDLHRPHQNYTGLIEDIKKLGSWAHYLESTWIVVTSLSPDQVRDKLKDDLDGNDAMLIVEITGDRYSGWLTQEAWDWLSKHVPSGQ